MKFLFLIVFTTLFGITYAQSIDCLSFHKGKYFYTPPNGGDVSMRRTKNKQYEKYNDEHQLFIFKVIWITDCDYSLTLIKTRGVRSINKKQIIGTVLICKIVNSDLEHYDVEILSNETNQLQRLTVYQE